MERRGWRASSISVDEHSERISTQLQSTSHWWTLSFIFIKSIHSFEAFCLCRVEKKVEKKRNEGIYAEGSYFSKWKRKKVSLGFFCLLFAQVVASPCSSAIPSSYARSMQQKERDKAINKFKDAPLRLRRRNGESHGWHDVVRWPSLDYFRRYCHRTLTLHFRFFLFITFKKTTGTAEYFYFFHFLLLRCCCCTAAKAHWNSIDRRYTTERRNEIAAFQQSKQHTQRAMKKKEILRWKNDYTVDDIQESHLYADSPNACSHKRRKTISNRRVCYLLHCLQ